MAQKPNWRPVTDRVFLYSTRWEEERGLAMVYEVECAQSKLVTFEFDISQSQNFSFAGLPVEAKRKETVIGPYQRTEVAKLVVIDSHKRAVLKIQYKWRLSELAPPSQLEIKSMWSIQTELVEVCLSLKCSILAFSSIVVNSS